MHLDIVMNRVVCGVRYVRVAMTVIFFPFFWYFGFCLSQSWDLVMFLFQLNLVDVPAICVRLFKPLLFVKCDRAFIYNLSSVRERTQLGRIEVASMCLGILSEAAMSPHPFAMRN